MILDLDRNIINWNEIARERVSDSASYSWLCIQSNNTRDLKMPPRSESFCHELLAWRSRIRRRATDSDWESASSVAAWPSAVCITADGHWIGFLPLEEKLECWILKNCGCCCIWLQQNDPFIVQNLSISYMKCFQPEATGPIEVGEATANLKLETVLVIGSVVESP